MNRIIILIIETLLSLVSEDLIKEGLDQFFDFLEDRVEATTTGIDDALVLPLIAKARAALDVPDGDD